MTPVRAVFLPRSRMWEGSQCCARRKLWIALGALAYFAIVLVIAFSIPLPEPPSPSVEINGKPGVRHPSKAFSF